MNFKKYEVTIINPETGEMFSQKLWSNNVQMCHSLLLDSYIKECGWTQEPIIIITELKEI